MSQSSHSPPRRTAPLAAILLLAAIVPTAVSALTPEPGGSTVTASSVSQFGITWSFSYPAQVGRFLNGDYYVVGPVTITRISPSFSSGRNGSMLNPGFGQYQGYDSREGESYRSNLVVTAPLTFTPGDVLVSTVSRSGSNRIPHLMANILPDTDGLSYGLLTSAAILTCVDAPKPQSFRPPYSGPRTIFPKSALRWDRLPRLDIAGSLPDVDFWQRVFERPWIDHLTKSWLNRYIHPTGNMPDYGREMTLAVGMASLILASDIPDVEKEALLYSFVQLGIDTWGLASQAGANVGWEAMGGHGNGRKWPMLFAGLMLGQSQILATHAVFSEDQQTYYGSGWNGATALYRHYHRSYPSSVWQYETRHPSTWSSQEAQAEGYRRTSTSIGWAGQALVARAMNAVDEWGHPAFFDYVDRWMMEPDRDDRATLEAELGARNLWVSWWNHYGQAASGYGGWEGTTVLRYPWDMWQRHRQGLDGAGDNSHRLDVALAGDGQGQVTSSPEGIACGSDCTHPYQAGTLVTLTPTPASGSVFSGWSGNADCSDGVVTLNADRQCTASFALASPTLHTLTVSRQGTGAGTVTTVPGGIDCGSDCTHDYPEGTVTTLTAHPAAGSVFSGWSGNADCSDGVVTLNADRQCAASFALASPTLHTLTVSRQGTGAGTVTTVPGGIDCGSDCTHDYAEGTVTTLTAHPAAGSVFAGWSGSADCSDGVVTLNADRQCTASFQPTTPQQFQLTVRRSGPGRGSVTTLPGGVDCGSDCQHSYPSGTEVVLQAWPDSGSYLREFRGHEDCRDGRVTMRSDITCEARFFRGKKVRAAVSGASYAVGEILSDPSGLACRHDCSAAFGVDAVVTLVAIPDPGWELIEWKGHPDCRDGVLQGRQGRNCKAVFAPIGEQPILFGDGFEGGDTLWWNDLTP